MPLAPARAVVNLVAGLVQLDGGIPSLPSEDEDEAVHLCATIKGARYTFHVILGERLTGDLYRFTATGESEELIKLGLVRDDGPSFRLFELPTEMFDISTGWNAPVSLEVRLRDLDDWEIRSFAYRI